MVVINDLKAEWLLSNRFNSWVVKKIIFPIDNIDMLGHEILTFFFFVGQSSVCWKCQENEGWRTYQTSLELYPWVLSPFSCIFFLYNFKIYEFHLTKSQIFSRYEYFSFSFFDVLVLQGESSSFWFIYSIMFLLIQIECPCV